MKVKVPLGFTQNNNRKGKLCPEFSGARGTLPACLLHQSMEKVMPEVNHFPVICYNTNNLEWIWKYLALNLTGYTIRNRVGTTRKQHFSVGHKRTLTGKKRMLIAFSVGVESRLKNSKLLDRVGFWHPGLF
ncbi:hypothetical protein MTR_3g028073 [Medicago truncatula]|uniref:Uncharacterized protein n=1 Tax=Medicago truncatula TaxID=3880 RepID=A0A072UVW0_MEDTR|nr:hypothetical protein MTR_3g028073 [Medicago truncatula]